MKTDKINFAFKWIWIW